MQGFSPQPRPWPPRGQIIPRRKAQILRLRHQIDRKMRRCLEQKIHRAVRAGIIDNKDLKIPHRLSRKRSNRAFQILTAIIIHDDDRKAGRARILRHMSAGIVQAAGPQSQRQHWRLGQVVRLWTARLSRSHHSSATLDLPCRFQRKNRAERQKLPR